MLPPNFYPNHSTGSRGSRRQAFRTTHTARRRPRTSKRWLPICRNFKPTDAEKFMRPDVHAGDRPSGASFATRSPALGLSGAAGTAHPLATQTAIAMLKRGGSRGGRGGGGQCCAGICGTGELGTGRRLFCVCVGSEGGQADGHGQLRPIAQGADAGNSAGAREEWRDSRAGRDCRFPRRARSMAGGRCTSATAS